MSISAVIPTKSFGWDYDVVVHSWNEKLNGYRRFDSGKQEPLEGGLGIDVSHIRRGDGGEMWVKTIPEYLINATENFPEVQYQMLWLAANSQDALDILHSRPIILALLCGHYAVDNEAVLRILAKGQRHCLSAIGLDGSKAALKFIDKLELYYVRDNELDYVREKLRVPRCQFKNFNHYQTIMFTDLLLDHRYPFLTGTRFAQSLASSSWNEYKHASVFIRDTIFLGEWIGDNNVIKRIGRLENLEQLKQLHDQWNAIRREEFENLRKAQRLGKDISYKLHLEERSNILQIKSYHALIKEAEELSHCVEIYHSKIMIDRYVVFKMVEPERVTIGITINHNLNFPYSIDQIMGYKNRLAKKSTLEAVYQWLYECRESC
ncbi:MAG: PcfJ domain-containing protein [Vibrio sp.]